MNPESSNPELTTPKPVPSPDHAPDSENSPPGREGRQTPVQESVQNAVRPEHVRVNQTEGTGVEITWKDGHSSHWTFTWLRDACPCATCVKERESSGRAPGEPRPQLGNSLPIYKTPLRPQRTRAVGNYAVSFDWSDGHRTGIYSWVYLRSICQCSICTETRS